ncbi:hypothetical protein RFI_21023 [Reticulomyxa filosa]|uniref:PH domain-containing protein n=1 Tax=Reticulomyxa filosa TaxID=46433 RepID=X6MQP7_RETFI|nr:hypothetical protein RFI_21023 [Reticulomyxa filosa]|eukprot:ETO16328.1 hypothetical protein RFI_21023 [Reticulomyxa filosa]
MAAETEKQRDEWLLRLKEAIDGAKQLVTSHEGYLWKKNSKQSEVWRKRYFAVSKGWLFYFASDFHCQKFKSIVFFSESFFQQAVQMYVKGNISLHETFIQTVDGKDIRNGTATQPKKIPQTRASPMTLSILDTKTLTCKYYFACDNEKEMNAWFQAFYALQNEYFTDTYFFFIFRYNQLCLGFALDKSSGVISQIATKLEHKENFAGVGARSTEKSNMNADEFHGMFDQIGSEEEEEDEEEKEKENEDEDEDESKDQIDFENDYMKGNHKLSVYVKQMQQKGSLFNLLDPHGTGKWRDLEDPALIQAQPDFVKNAGGTSQQLKGFQ